MIYDYNITVNNEELISTTEEGDARTYVVITGFDINCVGYSLLSVHVISSFV